MLRQSVPRELTLFWGVSKVYNLTNNRLQLKHKSHVFYSISCPISNHRAHLASWYERSWRSWKLYHVLFGMQIRYHTCIRCYISAVPLRKLLEQMVGRGGARQLTWGASCAPLLTKTGYFSLGFSDAGVSSLELATFDQCGQIRFSPRWCLYSNVLLLILLVLAGAYFSSLQLATFDKYGHIRAQKMALSVLVPKMRGRFEKAKFH